LEETFGSVEAISVVVLLFSSEAIFALLLLLSSSM
jgi:hypothetical protein